MTGLGEPPPDQFPFRHSQHAGRFDTLLPGRKHGSRRAPSVEKCARRGGLEVCRRAQPVCTGSDSSCATGLRFFSSWPLEHFGNSITIPTLDGLRFLAPNDGPGISGAALFRARRECSRHIRGGQGRMLSGIGVRRVAMPARGGQGEAEMAMRVASKAHGREVDQNPVCR